MPLSPDILGPKVPLNDVISSNENGRQKVNMSSSGQTERRFNYGEQGWRDTLETENEDQFSMDISSRAPGSHLDNENNS